MRRLLFILPASLCGVFFIGALALAQPLQLDYSTYLGGTGNVVYSEAGRSIAVAGGEAYVTGTAVSTADENRPSLSSS